MPLLPLRGSSVDGMYDVIYLYIVQKKHSDPIKTDMFMHTNVCNHHQPINAPTAGAYAFLMDYT
jgi:hypothetical protein